MQVDLRILRFDPGARSRSRTGRSYVVAVGAHGPGARPAPSGQVGARRSADVPPVVRPWRVRLGRDADQRPQPAGVQDPRRPARAQDHRSRRCPACRSSRTSSSTWTTSSPSTAASCPTSWPTTSHRRTRSGSSRQHDRERYDDTTKCILCAACTSSCPSFWAQPEYVGPAAIVNAHRFIFDSRDDHADERLEILADQDGVWRCRTIFNCVDACPRGINITRAILEVIERDRGAQVAEPRAVRS